jgi:hypothetical protein
MESLHPFEKMWREYRSEWKEHLKKTENNILKKMKEDEFEVSEEIYIPLFMIESELYFFFKNSNDISKDEAKEGSESLAKLIKVLITWRRDKSIYKIDEKLYECIENAKLPENTPFTCIKLPRNSILIDIPNKPYYLCYYECVGLDSGDEFGTSEKFLVIAEIEMHKPNPYIQLYNVDANCRDLNEYLMHRTNEASKTEEKIIKEEVEYQKELKEKIGPILNILAYINGNEDVVSEIHPGEKIVTNIKNPEKLRRMQDLSLPIIHKVGEKFKSVLERWELSNKSDTEGNEIHKSPRPHIRCAHSHLYWTGEGRKEPKVKFLPPIPVKGGISGEPEYPHTTIVK